MFGGNPNNVEQIPFVKPSSYIKHFLESAPELLFAGSACADEAHEYFKSFWGLYKADHEDHPVYQQPELQGSTIPCCIHGDEGRGLKKTNTTVVTMETCIGIDSHLRRKRGQHFDGCDRCVLQEPDAKRFRLPCGKAKPVESDRAPVCSFLTTNMKRHCFLSKFPLIVLPNAQYRNHPGLLDELLTLIFDDMKDMCENGVEHQGRRFRLGFCGMKGDLKWFADKLCKLNRSFKQVTSLWKEMCHECLAGSPTRPFEDVSLNPTWASSQFALRPWSTEPLFSRIPFSSSLNQPEKCIRRDLFHNGKVGLLRDFCGSSIRTLAYLEVFHEPTESNKIDVLLTRAHSHFLFFCANGIKKRSPKLRSFTVSFLNCSTRRKYPWVNSHGSDTHMLVEWLAFFTGTLMLSPMPEADRKIVQQIFRTAKSALEWLSHLYTHGAAWSRHCGAVFFSSFWKFIKGYTFLAKVCLEERGWAVFALKPKLHLLDHSKRDVYVWLMDCRYSHFPSPLLWNCEGNEDTIGRLCRTSRRVSPMLTSSRCFDMFMIKQKSLYKRFVAEVRAQNYK